MKRETICLITTLILLPLITAHSLPQGVSIIKGTSASIQDNSDLRPLRQLARQASVFGIGESAHGVAGYQDFQFRLSKWLIESFGYRRIFSEIISSDVTLNDFLLKGEGNLTTILYNNPWQGSDKNMFDFFSWVREWNVQHPRQTVTAHIVDPQAPWDNAAVIGSFLQKWDAASGTSFHSEYFPTLLSTCFGAKYANQVEWAYSPEYTAYFSRGGRLLDNETVACTSTIDYLTDLFQSEQNRITKVVARSDFGNVINALRMLRSWQIKSSLLYIDPINSMRVREAAFGLSVMSQYENAGDRKSKAILISHNLHLAKAILKKNFDNSGFFNDLRSVGYQMRWAMGDAYVAIAQSGYNVSAMFGRPYPIPTSPQSIDVTLEALDEKFLLLDTSARWIQKQDWLVQEESVPNGRYYNLRESFDALVFHSIAPKGIFVNAAASQASEMTDNLSV